MHFRSCLVFVGPQMVPEIIELSDLLLVVVFNDLYRLLGQAVEEILEAEVQRNPRSVKGMFYVPAQFGNAVLCSVALKV